MESNIEIANFVTDYTEDLVKLWKECDLIVPWNDPYEDISLKMKFQPELLFIAVKKHELIGSVMVGYEGHRGWINYLAVKPVYQKKGIGRLLMTHAEIVLKQMGCVKVNLQVRETNENVIKFYESIGYKQDKVVGFGKRLKS